MICMYIHYYLNLSKIISLYISYIFLYNQFARPLAAITLCKRLWLSIVYGIPWYYVTHLSDIGATTGTGHTVGTVGVTRETKQRRQGRRGTGRHLNYDILHASWHLKLCKLFERQIGAAILLPHSTSSLRRAIMVGAPLPCLAPPPRRPLSWLCIAYFTAHRLIFNSRELPQF